MLLYRRPDEYDLERFGDEDHIQFYLGVTRTLKPPCAKLLDVSVIAASLATLSARILIIYSSLPTAIIRETAKCVRPQLRPLRVYN